MLDVRRDYDNYRTRAIRVAVSNPDYDYKDNELILFRLPKNILVLRTYVCVVEADSTSGATIDLVAVPAVPKPKFADFESSDAVVIADEVAIDSKGVKGCDTCETKQFDKEMIIATRNGDVAGTGDAVFSVIVEFLELDNKAPNGLLRIPQTEVEAITE